MPIDGGTAHSLEKGFVCGISEAVGIMLSELGEGAVKFCKINPTAIKEKGLTLRVL